MNALQQEEEKWSEIWKQGIFEAMRDSEQKNNGF